MSKQVSRIERRANRHRVALLVPVVGTLLALAGCGGVGDADDLSTQQYVSSGQAICRAVQERLDVLGKKVRRKPTSTAVGNSARKSAQAIGAGVDQLDLLPEPARLSAAADRFSRALLDQARVLDRLAAAVEAQDLRALRRMPSRLRESEARAAVGAQATGLTACGRRDLALGLGRPTAGRSASRPAAADVAGAEERDDTAARAARAAPDIELNAADVARARSVLIRRSDLISVWGPEPEVKATARPGIPRCPGFYMPDRSGLTITGTAESVFTNGADRIGSNALAGPRGEGVAAPARRRSSVIGNRTGRGPGRRRLRVRLGVRSLRRLIVAHYSLPLDCSVLRRLASPRRRHQIPELRGTKQCRSARSSSCTDAATPSRACGHREPS
jgi:hypothetical protein